MPGSASDEERVAYPVRKDLGGGRPSGHLFGTECGSDRNSSGKGEIAGRIVDALGTRRSGRCSSEKRRTRSIHTAVSVYFEDLCRDIRERAAPNAPLLNYSNPNAMATWAANAYGEVRTVGLCHGVQHGHQQLAEALGVPRSELVYSCVGINHLAWYRKRVDQVVNAGAVCSPPTSRSRGCPKKFVELVLTAPFQKVATVILFPDIRAFGSVTDTRFRRK